MSALTIALLAACTRSTEPVEPAIPPADEPTEEPAPAEEPTTGSGIAPDPNRLPHGSSPVGGWSSKSCGDRTYERFVHIQEGGSFSGEERVSPCPEDASCAWSGIHTFSGTWNVAGETLSMTVSKTDAQGEAAEVWPASLTYTGGRVLEGECLYGPASTRKPAK